MVNSQAANWSQVADLCPQLRQHIHTYPQDYRGKRWYVLRDETNGRHLRFNAAAYEFIGHLNGGLSVQQIWDLMKASDAGTELEQSDILLILTQLFSIYALANGLSADATEFFKRYQHERRLNYKRAVMNPLAIRIPLLDPDRLLNWLLPWVRPLFTGVGGAVWLIIVVVAGLLAITNFRELSSTINQDILSPANLLLMLPIFIFIKVIHEFSHAFAVKIWGGEVHEMGISLLVLAPVPYVDASSAWGFRDKYKRALVGAVGICAELFLAALAVYIWLAVEPGLVKDAAFNAILIGSVSTLLFNANPLLRFDGYYVLQDLIEIPNLYTRSNQYYLYIIKRYLFGIEAAHSPVTAAGERGWFIFYGISALIYRLTIMVAIVFFLTQEYLIIGVALASWMIIMQLILPVVRGVRFLLINPMLTGLRCRAIGVSIITLSSLTAVGLYFPVSLTSHTEGIVWVPDKAQVVSGAEGFISEVLVESGTHVESGTLLMRLAAPTLDSRVAVLEARQRQLEIRHVSSHLKERVKSSILALEIVAVKAELDMLREQQLSLQIFSEVAGTFVVPNGQVMRGRYLEKGQLIGYVITPERLIVKLVVPQAFIGLVDHQVEQVEVRLAERLEESFTTEVLRITPAGSTSLPSRALGAAGGGNIAVSTVDGAGTIATEKVFRLDLSLPNDIKIAGVGERVYVRFHHGNEPLVSQWLRSWHQLLLSRLSL